MRFSPLATLKRLLARVVAPGDPAGSRTWQGLRSFAGPAVTEDSALALSAVWACVRLISEAVAALPWRAYRTLPSGGRELTDGRGVDWLLHRQPNPEMTPFTFRQVLLSHCLLWGNGYAEIERDQAGRPSWLWPLPPDVTRPVRLPDGSLGYEVSPGATAAYRLPARDVFHLKGLGFDGLSGYSVIGLARQSVGLGLATEAYGARFFGNGGKPGGLLKYPHAFKDAKTGEKIAEEFDKATSGSRQHRTVVLENGMDYLQLTVPPEDAQFLETRKFTVTEVCRWFRCPPHKVGDLERATFSNIEHQSIEFLTDTLDPWLVALEQEADRKLFGDRLQGYAFTKFTRGALLRGDAASRGQYYRQMFDMGVFSPNEIRELEDLNPLGEEGDLRFVQVNLQTLERAGEEPPEPEPPPAPAEPAEPDDAADPEPEPDDPAPGGAE